MEKEQLTKRGPRWIWILVLVIIAIFAVMYMKNNERNKQIEKQREELLMAFVDNEMLNMDKSPMSDVGYFKINFKDVQNFIPEMTGLTSETEGAFTVYRKIYDASLDVYPQKTGKLMHLPPCKMLPEGALTKVTDIIQTDSIVMIKFRIENPVQTLNDMTIQLDSMLKELENLSASGDDR